MNRNTYSQGKLISKEPTFNIINNISQELKLRGFLLAPPKIVDKEVEIEEEERVGGC
jgi:hypothetical protein